MPIEAPLEKKWRDAQKILEFLPGMIHNSLNAMTLQPSWSNISSLLSMSPPPSSFGVDLARLSRVALFFAP
jgi:hypothetical protein